MKGYRFVTEDLRSEHGTVQWVVDEWQHFKGNLEMCKTGLHASKEPMDSLRYIFGSRWFICEAKGKILKDTDKFCASDMRLLKEIPVTVIKRFAIECAKHVLPIFEKEHPSDKRPREAIEATEKYLAEPTEENLKKLDAARNAAGAAQDAAWAAWAAAWAAWAAARDAAWAAARAAEEKWQKRTLNKLIKQAIKEA